MSESEKYTLVELDDPAYKVLRELVGAHHSTIAEAEIALVYEHGVKPDCDGHLVWGRAKKVGPLEQSFREHDFTILLNAEVWATLPKEAKRALLDHELSHCGAKTDDAGETTYYLRKHDLEEFQEIVRRHGLWRANVESFVNAALKREQTPLFPALGKDAPGPGAMLKEYMEAKRPVQTVHMARAENPDASLCGSKEVGSGWLTYVVASTTCVTCLSMFHKLDGENCDVCDSPPEKQRKAKKKHAKVKA